MDPVVSYVIEPENSQAGALLVGSHTRKHRPTKPSDRDYVIVSPEDRVGEIATRIRAHAWFQDVSDDSFRLVDSWVEYGLCLLSREAFRARIDAIHSQDFVQRDWALGCVMPEGFTGDVEHGVIESDTHDKLLESAQSVIWSSKPQHILKLRSATLHKLHSLALLLQKHGDDAPKREIIKGQVLIFLIRLFYLENYEFCNGMKHFTHDARQFGQGKNIVGLIHILSRSDLKWEESFYDFLK